MRPDAALKTAAASLLSAAPPAKAVKDGAEWFSREKRGAFLLGLRKDERLERRHEPLWRCLMTLSKPVDPEPRAIGSLTPGAAPARPGKVGVMLVNLGTPDGTDFKPMWRYLREFLSDPRVIELNKLIWYPILYGPVLTFRPSKSGANYAKIWNRERNESPLHTFTRSQGEKLAASLRDLPNVTVDWAMRYGNPSTGSVVRKLVERIARAGLKARCGDILVPVDSGLGVGSGMLSSAALSITPGRAKDTVPPGGTLVAR